MKRRFVKFVPAVAMVSLAMAAFAGRAVANSSTYAFTMKLRYVDGKGNNKPHTLDAGELTLSAQIWITSKNARAASTPQPITIEVSRDSLLSHAVVCTLTMMPDVTFNSKRASSRSCGHINGGTYWISVSKDKAMAKDGDGWHSQGSGTVTTK